MTIIVGVGVGLLAIVNGFIRFMRGIKAHSFQERIDKKIKYLSEEIPKSFLVQPCSRCHEYKMELIEISPNARSIQYKCQHCNKHMRAVAGSERSIETANYWRNLVDILSMNKNEWGYNVNAEVVFYTPSNPMPYERTTREPIPESIRSQVWRRDGGKCVECESTQNLQFDHIIPVSKGGATTVENLQILCRQCNLSKHAKI